MMASATHIRGDLVVLVFFGMAKIGKKIWLILTKIWRNGWKYCNCILKINPINAVVVVFVAIWGIMS